MNTTRQISIFSIPVLVAALGYFVDMVRGALVGIAFMFEQLQISFSYINAGIITGVVVMIISVIAVAMIDETFNKDLDFYEH